MALARWGIKMIVARSFAAIFRSNATSNGLVCVDVDEVAHYGITVGLADGLTTLSVDVDHGRIMNSSTEANAGHSVSCTIPAADRDMLLQGTWDTAATLLAAGRCIEETAAWLAYKRQA